MNIEQVAQKVVELVRKQAWHEALDTLYDKDIVSIEARASEGDSPEKRGIDQVRGKTDWGWRTCRSTALKRTDNSSPTIGLLCSTMPTSPTKIRRNACSCRRSAFTR